MAQTEKIATGDALLKFSRYTWQLLRPVIGDIILQNLEEYEQNEHAEIGPAAPLQTAESPAALRENLRIALDSFKDEPPFTIQRLCEVVLEPKKQYQKLDKLALSLEKLLMVSSTMPLTTDPPALPTLADIKEVNECPPTVRVQHHEVTGVAVGNGDMGSAPKRQVNTENELGLATAALHAAETTPVEVVTVPPPDPPSAPAHDVQPMETDSGSRATGGAAGKDVPMKDA